MRIGFVVVLTLAFIAQQFSCCCGNACRDVASTDTNSACCEHDADGHHHGDEEPDGDHRDSHHQHHACVGAHLFFVLPDAQTIDLAPQPCLAASVGDLLKSLQEPKLVHVVDRWSIHAANPQQRRAILCVYTI